MKKVFVVLAAALLLSGCAAFERTERENTREQEFRQEQESQPAPEPAFEWSKAAPEEKGVNGAALEAVHSTIDDYNILTCVIVRDGVIVDEYYKDGYDQNSVFVLNSASKSVAGAIVGIAIDKGYIGGVDEPASDYIDGLDERITIWNLLTHTSGIAMTDTDDWAQWRASDNWIEYVLSRPVTARLGSEFRYSTGNTHLLSAIVQKATGQTALEFARQYLFEPLDMDTADCLSDAQGISDGGNGFIMNPYDMAKFGQLFLNGGVWEGENIISSEWIEQSTTVQFDRSSGSADYGYQWWVRTFGGHHAYFAQGHAGQYIFVVPDLELVFTFTSDYTGSTSVYWSLAQAIVEACE